MNGRRKFFLTFLFIVIDAVLLVCFFVVRDAAMLNTLKKEVSSLAELDMTKDRYQTEIKTKGDYGKVEKAIKKYLDQDALLLQESIEMMKDSKLSKILSYENYEADGPEFSESIAYLESTKKTFQDNISKVLKDFEEGSEQDYIYKKIEDPYYCDLFVELLQSDSMKSDVVELKEVINTMSVRMLHIINTSHEILDFLIQNKDYWVLEEGEIRFKNPSLYQQYLDFIAKLNV